jgi:type IV pilus assembly protein PilC
MNFIYKATTKDGKTISGTAEAANKQALLMLLHRQNVNPILIEQDKKTKLSLNMTIGVSKKVKSQDLVIFTRQLSTMISAGVPLARSMSALANDTESPYLKEVLNSVTKDIESGKSLAESFAKFPTVFDQVFIAMIRAGEEGGILDEILKRLASQVELNESIKKKIKSAMMYPIVILVVTILAFFGIMLFIMPKISKIISSLAGPKAKLPIYSQVLLDFSKDCVNATIVRAIPGINAIPVINNTPNMLLVLVILGIGAYYLLKYIKTEPGKYKFHSWLLRIPIVKIIVLKVAIARFSRTFASLMAAGVTVLDALDITGAAIGNKVIEAELKAASKEVQNGKQLSDPISKSPHFPPIVAQMLMVGEETGQVDQVLGKIADFYEEEVGVLIDGLAALIEPIMIIFLGAAVGLIALSVMGPIANLTRQIPTSSN